MTTARMRAPPLRPLNGRSAGGPRGKRKSAVELLQETKAFYVKSETVRDTKQQFCHTRSPDSCVMAPMQPVKSPRCSQQSSELQDRLRLLLDVDSKENLDNRYSRPNRTYRESSGYRGGEGVMALHPISTQHKSLPDLHHSPNHSSSDSEQSSYDGRQCVDARSAYSSGTQPGFGGFGLYSTKSSDFRRPAYTDYFSGRCEFPMPDPRVYASLRVTKSGEMVYPRSCDVTQTQYWRRNSNTSSGNRSQHNSSSRHSQSADSGRQSQVGSGGLRTGRSGLPEVISPPPLDTASDSGAEDGSPPLYRANSYDKDKRRPILRSKSDTAYRYCANRPPLALPLNTSPHPHLTSDQLERFFDHLGMDPASYRELATLPPRSTSPVFFSSVSSMDSCLDLRSWAVAETIARPPESLSVVERNARIIKWLCNCRKAQMAELTLV